MTFGLFYVSAELFVFVEVLLLTQMEAMKLKV